MLSANKSKIIILAGIGLGILVLAYYTGYGRGDKEPLGFFSQPQTQIQTPSPIFSIPNLPSTPNTTSNITSEIDFSSWKNYRNEKYDYEVKYPAEWKGGEKSLTTKVASFTPEEKDAAQTGFWIYVYENPKGLTSKEWWEREYKKGSAVYSYEGTFQISGINAEVYKEEGGLEYTYYLLSKNSRIYLILSAIVKERMRQILSTFKFI
ncbi:hypothetical protein ANME2D_02448 [Candidatus Methanoperedens nitroreducens]|uniref:Uncharacterized protein n=1 Tax=Candidatus Methanoperedens nitratireducens TaxID=1392998 RepID=A0A062V1I8_9EURY|nr:hypothetical protein [Candidatus Methanoperedens nitroreducens]KCZ71247.1 hypothetical protein ANME2D_02448 [Candidatus Methanoperedens nitroreducens]MDJ1420327.1 hypothetical protein [Candidatus Methanoperedens sp.]